MTLTQAVNDLQRRVSDARKYADDVEAAEPIAPAWAAKLAAALRREAECNEAAAHCYNKEGVLLAIGRLHGLCYAAAVLLEGRVEAGTAK